MSFPVQMLGKSFKMMPVMLWGIVISGKRYGMKDWAVAMCVTLGVTSFLLTGPVSSKTSTGNSVVGFLLLWCGRDDVTIRQQVGRGCFVYSWSRWWAHGQGLCWDGGTGSSFAGSAGLGRGA